MRIAIAGGGIAGLTSAVALSQRGFEVEVFERSERLEEVGAGIQLSPNATAVLETLGIMAELAGKVSEPAALAIRDAGNGALLARMPLGQVARARYGNPYCTLHRADLQTALLSAARRQTNVSIVLNADVSDVEDFGTVVAFRAGGERRRADVLLAADGVHSRIRTGHFGYPGPTSFNRNAWRAVVPAKNLGAVISPNEIGLWLGSRGHLVHYPVNAGASLNIVVIASGNGPEPPSSPFGPTAKRAIESVQTWSLSSLMGVDLTRPQWRGRVILIGDAAHAIAPSAAQGGALAIEDAWTLAAALATSPSEHTKALTSYAASRAQRTARVASLALNNLNAYELIGVPAILRNSILRISPAMLMLSRFDWLFGWRPK